MDMKRVEEIEKDLNNVLMHTKGIDHVLHRMDDVKELIQTIKQQHTLIQELQADRERYKGALEEITHVGWSEAFGGGIQYSGESHGDCIKIARKALEGGGG